MKLEDQVCSLEYAKKLKELGVEQESIFVYEYYDDSCYGIKYIPHAILPNEYNNVKWYSAFTVSELGVILPYITEKNESSYYFLKIQKEYYKEWIIFYENDEYLTDSSPYFMNNTLCSIIDRSEADARAKMLIYLIENKLIPEQMYK